jgi:predicted peptidase
MLKTNSLYFLFFILHIICLENTFAQKMTLAQAETHFEKLTFAHQGQTLPYRLLKPAKIDEGKTYPLLVFLHGAGERGEDNSAQLTHAFELFLNAENRAKFPCFVLVPQCPNEKKWADLDWTKTNHTQPTTSETMHTLLALIADYQQHKHIDNKKMYALGLSMGGYGVWDLLYRNANFAAAGLICGGGDARTAEKINCPIWFFHGAKDKLVPVENGRNLSQSLKKTQPKTVYTEYPTVGHGAWIPALQEKNLLNWLFSHSKP